MIDRDPREVVAELAARIERLEAQYDALRIENKQLQGDVMDSDHNELVQLRAERQKLRAALRQILEDPDAQILDSHRDDGWEALRTV